MKEQSRLYQGSWFCLLNAFLVFLMVFFLLPGAVSRANADSDTVSPNITSESNANNDNLLPLGKNTPEDELTDKGTSFYDLPPTKKKIKPDESDNITSPSGKIILDIPSQAVIEEIEVEFSEKTPPGSTGMRIVNLFELNAYSVDVKDDDIGIDVATQGAENDTTTENTGEKYEHFKFEKELTLTIQHSEEELAGLDTDSLHLYYLNEETGEWEPVKGKFDKETLTLTATINHFSYYGENANPLQSGPGRVMASQVDLNSGAATYNYPIELPPGPGGFQPSVSLNYSSGSVDGMKNKRDVGSWVGIGWSLHFGRISYSDSSKEYFLDLNGGSYQILSVNGTEFRTNPEQHFKITRSSLQGNTWEVLDKDGNYFRFGGTTDSQQYNNTSSYYYYRWDLSYWHDTNGNGATITYARDIWSNSVRSAYPKFLRYDDNKVQVEFITSYSQNSTYYGVIRADTPITSGNNPTPTNIENRQLDRIEIKVNGNLIKKYGFSYTVTNKVPSTDYGGIYYSGYIKLNSVTQYGTDGISALPATSFTYETRQVYRKTVGWPYTGNPGNPASITWPFLKIVNSGYGGNVTFTYTQIPGTSVNDIWTRQVVTTKTINGGIGTSQTYTYEYTGNPDYFGTGWDQEFIGWKEVKETDPNGNYTLHSYYTTGTPDEEFTDPLRGREYNTKWYEAGDPATLLKETNYAWNWLLTDTPAEGGYVGFKSGGTITKNFVVAPDGNIWIAYGNRIHKYDSNLNLVTSPFDNINIICVAMAVDSQGNIYAKCSDNYIRKYNNTGSLLLQFLPSITDLYSTGEIAASGDGQVYVLCQCRVYINGIPYPYFSIARFSSTGSFINRYDYPICYDTSITRPDDIAAAPSGDVHVAVFSQYNTNYYDTYSVFTYNLSAAGGWLFGTSGGGLCLTVSVNDEKYATNSSWTTVKNASIPNEWGKTNQPCRLGIGDSYVYVGENNNNVSFYAKYNWVVQLDQVEEITYSPSGARVSRTRYEYDENGNVVAQYLDGDTSNPNDDSVINREYYPNTSANILGKVAHEWVTDASSNIVKDTRYYYDGNTAYTTPPSLGNLTRTEQINNGTPASVNSYISYYGNGNIQTSTDPSGNVTSFTYETLLNAYPASKSMPLGMTETYAYTWNWSEDGGTGTMKVTITDVNNVTTTSYYDKFDRLWKVVKIGDTFGSPSIEYQYNSWGTLNSQCIKTITKVDTSNFLWSCQYFDGLGRVIQTQTNGESGHTIIASTVVYNNRGLAEKQYVSQDIPTVLTSCNTTGIENWKFSTSIYDALGRVVTQTGADGCIVSSNFTTAWQERVTNPNGHTTIYDYDAFGRLIIVTENDGTQDIITTYKYDVLGNLTDVWTPAVDQNHSSMTYDMLSRKTSMNDPDMGYWTYVYDNNGNLITQTDAKTQPINMAYDALNRLITKSGTGLSITYGYDSISGGNFGKGKRTSMVDNTGASGSTTYKYDNRGRLIEEKRTINSINYTTSYTYDGADRVKTVTYPLTNEVVTQTYNGRSLPYELSGSSAGSIVTNTQYNSLGAMTEINLNNGLVTTYGYYGTGGPYDTTGGYYGRLWEIKTFNQGGGPALQDMRYTWDANGNLSYRADIRAGETETFAYDVLDRLTSVTGLYTESYTYNRIGNITSRNGVTYSYNDSAHIHAVTAVGSMSYTYDANGNMITRGDQTLTWDIENRLASVSGNSTSATFVYDGDGNRVKKIEGSQTILYINQYYEVNLISGNATSSYYLGGKLIATFEKGVSENGTLRYVHQDSLSSTSLMTDDDGVQIGATVKYLPFGGTRAGNVPTDKLFTGQRLDETGLYYYNARYYDATIGRFISADTVIQSPANPQYLNRYSYGLNNPLKYTDPTGHSPAWFLNSISNLFNSCPLFSIPGLISANILLANAFNIYNGFHEIAQVYIAQRLSEMGYQTQLEYKVGKNNKVDVVANDFYAWEVKAKGDNPTPQLNGYISKSNGTLTKGFYMEPIENITIVGDIKMRIDFDTAGGANYSFYQNSLNGEQLAVSSVEVKNEVKNRFGWGVGVAGAILIATFAEDIITAGAGVADDLASLYLAMTAVAASFR
jgi:RHS repeat-associated protein